jgi:hypothetical protein
MAFAICSLDKFKHKGKKHPKGIRVCQYDTKWALIRCFEDSIVANEVTKISYSGIRKAATWVKKSAGGYLWCDCPEK